jgi:hypothetical protein
MREVTIPWGRWERLTRQSNQTTLKPFSGSMLDRHLFGPPSSSLLSSAAAEMRAKVVAARKSKLRGSISSRQHSDDILAPPTGSWEIDRSQVARVMIFKLPRSGSTWFTELINKLPTVFASKEIIQAEFDVTYGAHARLRHLKRSLLWPTGKMSTGPWYVARCLFYPVNLSLPYMH